MEHVGISGGGKEIIMYTEPFLALIDHIEIFAANVFSHEWMN